uniref:NADH dehydrogenase subunit 2 n=1 Tax=Dermatobranchus otome TaxID=1504997 RepID=UPI001FF6E00E|nr:NADH dehydrogenase subunit 2 [Dermatobranchus otome]UOD76593.1 NADH dehydrogenase subunit 2 [Dermatobranchus otome]UOD76606.1 NADH dehydrogenase subunit 2 [Dermatobranchus otome]
MSSGNLLFYSLMLVGPFLTISSSNWMICWVGVEISFLGLMPVLMSDYNFFSLSKESSMKYFCIQALGSALLFCGGIVVYMFPMNVGLVSEVIFFGSLVIKLGVFPAHFWVPGVVSGLGWHPMFLLLTWQKVAPLFLMVKFVVDSPLFSEVLLILGGFSAVVGAVIGLNQSKVSPMLGASSVTHSGWVMLGVVYGCLWTYFLIYCVTLGFLLAFASAGEKFFSGIGILSLSGLPPFTMFVGKWAILKFGLISSISYWFLFLPLLGSVMSLFYYLKFFYSFYLEEEWSGLGKWDLFYSFSMFVLVGSYYVGVY